MNHCQICKKEIPKRYTESVKKYNTHVVCSRICYRDWAKLPEQRIMVGKANIGNKYNLGKKRTKEQVEYITSKLRGRVFSEQGKKNMGLAKKGVYPKSFIGLPAWNKGLRGHNSGEKHHNWKGGKTALGAKIRTSADYLKWRKEVFERDSYTCKECGIKNGHGKTIKLNADHIKPFAFFPELRLSLDNGRTLCHECHKKTDTYGRKSVLKYKNLITVA